MFEKTREFMFKKVLVLGDDMRGAAFIRAISRLAALRDAGRHCSVVCIKIN